MDIAGPLPTAPAQKKLLLTTTDYFIKWIEAEGFASIKDKDVTQFIWKNIVYLFDIYNRRVKPRVFHPGDLVLMKVFENTVDPVAGKFQPN